ncbi:MAG: hypothetical protein B6I37_07695 [Desulfobacteraceae bacterium 4572_35.2]|nr:MAG: hypothetical protein B6I37_07695 [Desulfobacteraceae bacterium 4572_35.2]
MMVSLMNELSGNAGRFARYCVEQCSIADLVASARGGVNYDTCCQWGITGEQWQDAIFAALEELRHRY